MRMAAWAMGSSGLRWQRSGLRLFLYGSKVALLAGSILQVDLATGFQGPAGAFDLFLE